jgi:hypothetical protein
MKGTNVLVYFTLPSDDWLLGMEYIPVAMLPDLKEEQVSIFSIGFFIFRIDFLINNKEE